MRSPGVRGLGLGSGWEHLEAPRGSRLELRLLPLFQERRPWQQTHARPGVWWEAFASQGLRRKNGGHFGGRKAGSEAHPALGEEGTHVRHTLFLWGLGRRTDRSAGTGSTSFPLTRRRSSGIRTRRAHGLAYTREHGRTGNTVSAACTVLDVKLLQGCEQWSTEPHCKQGGRSTRPSGEII